MSDSATSESASEGALRTLALLGRLAPGLEHRINNLATVLMISAQQVSEFSSVADEQKSHVEQILSETSETLALMQALVTRHGSADMADLSGLVRAVGSIVAGLNHRVSVAVDPGTNVRVAGGQTEVRDLLLMTSLALHAVIPQGGHIRVEVNTGPSPTCIGIAKAKSGQPQALAEAISDDLEHLDELLARANAELATSADNDSLTLTLRFRPIE